MARDRVQEWLQAVVLDLLHEGQESAKRAFGDSLPGKPVQVVSGQVGERLAFVLAVGHLQRDEFLEIRGIIGREGHAISLPLSGSRLERAGRHLKKFEAGAVDRQARNPWPEHAAYRDERADEYQ